MKILGIIGILFITSSQLFSQNLIKNAGFEERYSNPAFFQSDTFQSRDWFIPNRSSPDYYFADNIRPGFGMPENMFGVHPAHEGIAYIGLCLFKWDGYLEQITGCLNEPLEKDSLYEFRINIRYSGSSSYLCVNKIGVLFSETKNIYGYNKEPWYDKMFIMRVQPDIEFNITISCGTTCWNEYRGLYKASGVEKYITIGLFYQSDLDIEAKIKQYRKAWPKGTNYEKRFYRRNSTNHFAIVNCNFVENMNVKTKMGYYFIDDLHLKKVSLH